MATLFRMNADELNITLLDFIKKTFKREKIALHIYEDSEMDGRDYLLSDPVSKQRLMEAVENGYLNKDSE